MTSQVLIKTPNIKITLILGFFASIIIIVLAVLFQFEFKIILLSMGGLIVASGGLLFVRKTLEGIIFWKNKVLEIKGQELDNRLKEVAVEKAEFQKFILTVPRTQRILMPPQSEIELIESVASESKPSSVSDVLEAELLNIKSVFMQSGMAYACIGGQQTGKTFQMRLIAKEWLNKNIKPLVVGPKWDNGEWEDCIKLGGRGDYKEVSRGIEIVKAIAEKRHDSSASHKSHQPLPVFFDDWTAVIEECDNAEGLIFNATVLYASVNIILYFIIHSDTANAWGVNKKGAALKNNFVKLFIIPHYSKDGIVVRELTKGHIVFPGKNVEHPAALGTFSSNIDSKHNEILRLWKLGKNRKEIAQEVFGGIGGNQYKRINAVLEGAIN